jgi:hypothetical protein
MASRLDTPGFFARSGDDLAKFGKVSCSLASLHAVKSVDADHLVRPL